MLQDLKNSRLINNSVTSLTHPQVMKALKNLKRGVVTGDLTYNKKGDSWLVTADSSVMKAGHPEFGKRKIGDKMPYQDDNTRVEGFLDLELSADAQQRSENADALAMATLSMQGAFDDVFSDNSASASVDAGADYDDLPEDTIPAGIAEDAFGEDIEEDVEEEVK